MHARINPFLEELQKQMQDYYSSNFPNSETKIQLSLELGKKYGRIVRSDNGLSRCSIGFIDRETGDIYKSASWKAPAKGIRGHVNNPPKPSWIYSIA